MYNKVVGKNGRNKHKTRMNKRLNQRQEDE